MSTPKKKPIVVEHQMKSIIRAFRRDLKMLYDKNNSKYQRYRAKDQCLREKTLAFYTSQCFEISP
jgi:hypothetical protein